MHDGKRRNLNVVQNPFFAFSLLNLSSATRIAKDHFSALMRHITLCDKEIILVIFSVDLFIVPGRLVTYLRRCHAQLRSKRVMKRRIEMVSLFSTYTVRDKFPLLFGLCFRCKPAKVNVCMSSCIIPAIIRLQSRGRVKNWSQGTGARRAGYSLELSKIGSDHGSVLSSQSFKLSLLSFYRSYHALLIPSTWSTSNHGKNREVC